MLNLLLGMNSSDGPWFVPLIAFTILFVIAVRFGPAGFFGWLITVAIWLFTDI